MNPSRKPARPGQQPTRGRAAAREHEKDLQPPATGAQGGSPAAGVMKQFAKTKAESTGRS